MEGAEARWVAAARAGDREALAELVRHHQDAVYHLALRLLDDPEEARDVAQEAFVRALTHLDRFDPGRPFRPWILRIAANLAQDRLRRARRRPLPLREDLQAAGEEGDPASAAIRRADVAALRHALAALPADYRLLVVLAHLQGRSYREIMEITGLSLTLVKNRLYRARLMLRRFLEREGGW